MAEEGMGSSEEEQTKQMTTTTPATPLWKKRKWLSKPLSLGDTRREIAWEKRRTRSERGRRAGKSHDFYDHVTDEDLSELRGCIELGFGFNEEDGQALCATLPALDLYFAVNRQLSASPRSSSSSSPSPTSDADSWKICSPGEDPEQVKMRLRRWAQAVACSVMQSS
ncbi:uncharacterized protein LOC114746271 [Neltuma alba]|uniref:uncharacterized protein LOC114746271 n=1 Tax=Neltuma alba TaxID=207710 RepID=UPI0010A534A4|nr:uncharacterized protein LOC114746271 [Prosopis alba]